MKRFEVEIKYIIYYENPDKKKEEIDLETFAEKYLLDIIVDGIEEKLRVEKFKPILNLQLYDIIIIFILGFLYINKIFFKQLVKEIIIFFDYEELPKEKIAKIIYLLRINIRKRLLKLIVKAIKKQKKRNNCPYNPNYYEMINENNDDDNGDNITFPIINDMWEPKEIRKGLIKKIEKKIKNETRQIN